MDVESPNSKEDQNLLLAPWGNNHQIVFSNGDMSPKIPRSPSSVFSFAPKSPGGMSGMRYCVNKLKNFLIQRYFWKFPNNFKYFMALKVIKDFPDVVNHFSFKISSTQTDLNLYFHYLMSLSFLISEIEFEKKRRDNKNFSLSTTWWLSLCQTSSFYEFWRKYLRNFFSICELFLKKNANFFKCTGKISIGQKCFDLESHYKVLTFNTNNPIVTIKSKIFDLYFIRDDDDTKKELQSRGWWRE